MHVQSTTNFHDKLIIIMSWWKIVTSDIRCKNLLLEFKVFNMNRQPKLTKNDKISARGTFIYALISMIMKIRSAILLFINVQHYSFADNTD